MDTKGNQAWNFTYTNWPNTTGQWVSVDLTTRDGYPSESLPVDAHETYKADNGIIMDIVIKNSYLWYRSFHPSGRVSSWTKINLAGMGFPPAAQNNLDSLSIFKRPNGQWQLTITKGVEAWNRLSQ